MKKKCSLNLSKQLNNKLHIVCFDVPFPATYGGVMDVFYKIRSLSESSLTLKIVVYPLRKLLFYFNDKYIITSK